MMVFPTSAHDAGKQGDEQRDGDGIDAQAPHLS